MITPILRRLALLAAVLLPTSVHADPLAAAAANMLAADPLVRKQAERDLLKAGPKSILPILNAVSNERGRRTASLLLGRMGPSVVPGLISALEDESLVRKAGPMLFSLITPASAPEAGRLVNCVRKIAEAKHYCGTALIKAMDAKAGAQLPVLRKALADADGDVRYYAAAALGHLKAAARPASEDLAKALKDSEPRMRLTAAISLEKIGGGSQKVREALKFCAANDSSAEVRRQAKAALRRAGA